jgi:hypothetical protein
MQYGDLVNVTVAGREVGLGTVVAVGYDRAKVVVHLPKIDEDFAFAASLSYFRPIDDSHWRIDMPHQTRRVFFSEG